MSASSKPLATFLLLSSLLPSTALAERYLVLGAREDRVRPSVRAALQARGATIRHDLSSIGVLVVDGPGPGFAAGAAGLADVRSVVADPPLDFTGASQGPVVAEDAPLALPTEDRLELQWGYHAVGAGQAYAAGLTGEGVRVAVIDSGADVANPDLAPNVNLALSRSFVLEEPDLAPPPVTGLRFHHGTYIAGLIGAAADNGGVVGIAPRAELVIVKVLNHGDGNGHFGDILAGMVYAGDIRADVVNMSLAAVLPRRGGCIEDQCFTAREIAEQWVALTRAAIHIRRHGGIVIAAAGNEGLDLDEETDTLVLPAMTPLVVAVSGTAPRRRALDPATSLDEPVSYSNTGSRLVTVAAPGGDADPELFLDASCVRFTSAGRRAFCYQMDMVLGLQQNGFAYAAGTSASAAHASGVAALIVESEGARSLPIKVDLRLRFGADDLGAPGHDPLFGHGRVHARSALVP